MKTSASSHEVATMRRQKRNRKSDEPLPFLSVAVFIALGLVSCGKKAAEPAKASSAPTSTQRAVVSNTRIESEITQALSGTAPAPVTARDLQREAEDIIAKYPGKTAADLLNVPEVSTKLRSLLGKLAQDKALQQRIHGSVDLAAQIQGLEGAAKLDLDIGNYDRARTVRMLQVALSDDPRQLVAFLVGEIGEAAPDLSFGGMERAPNGVAILPDPATTPTPSPNSPIQPD